MRKVLFILILSLSFYQIAFGTPQSRDIVYWNNNKYYMFPFIDIDEIIKPDELATLNASRTEVPPTSNYRGYLLGFKISNDSLFLVSIWDANKTDLTEFVLGKCNKRWINDFSDTLYLGYGQCFYEESFWTPVYESEMTVVFKNGVVQWFKDNKNKTRHSSYPGDVKMFMEFIYSNIRWDSLNQAVLAKKPKVYVSFENDSTERIEKVEIRRSSGYSEFDKEAVRVMKTIPSFSVTFVCGKYITHKYDYCIVFDEEKAKKMGIETHSDKQREPRIKNHNNIPYKCVMY